MALTEIQKQAFKQAFTIVKEALEGNIAVRDERGTPIELKGLWDTFRRTVFRDELGIKKDWAGFIEGFKTLFRDYEFGNALHFDIQVKGKHFVGSGNTIACQIMEWKCDLLKNHPNYAGDGQDCPAFQTHFCCGFEDSIHQRALLQRKCLIRIAEHMVAHGELVDYLRPVNRACKTFCPHYDRCVSSEVLGLYDGTRDPALPSVKMIVDQFWFCLLMGEDISKEKIRIVNEILAMCE